MAQDFKATTYPTGKRTIEMSYDDATITKLGPAIFDAIIDSITEKFLASETDAIMRNIDRAILRDRILSLVADRIVDRLFQATNTRGNDGSNPAI